MSDQSPIQIFSSPCRINSLNICRGKVLSGNRLSGKRQNVQYDWSQNYILLLIWYTLQKSKDSLHFCLRWCLGEFYPNLNVRRRTSCWTWMTTAFENKITYSHYFVMLVNAVICCMLLHLLCTWSWSCDIQLTVYFAVFPHLCLFNVFNFLGGGEVGI